MRVHARVWGCWGGGRKEFCKEGIGGVMSAQAKREPGGSLAARHPAQVVRVHTTTGPGGMSGPLRVDFNYPTWQVGLAGKLRALA